MLVSLRHNLRVLYIAPLCRSFGCLKPASTTFHFRIFVTGGILAGAILLFSFLETEGTSHSTNVVLTFIMGAIVLGTVVCAYVLPYLPYMDATSQLKRSFEWELTSDKVVQRHREGRAIEIRVLCFRSDENGDVGVGGFPRGLKHDHQ